MTLSVICISIPGLAARCMRDVSTEKYQCDHQTTPHTKDRNEIAKDCTKSLEAVIGLPLIYKSLEQGLLREVRGIGEVTVSAPSTARR